MNALTKLHALSLLAVLFDLATGSAVDALTLGGSAGSCVNLALSVATCSGRADRVAARVGDELAAATRR